MAKDIYPKEFMDIQIYYNNTCAKKRTVTDFFSSILTKCVFIPSTKFNAINLSETIFKLCHL